MRRRWARLRQTQELEADQMSQPWAETLRRLNASVKHPERNWRRGCGQQAGVHAGPGTPLALEKTWFEDLLSSGSPREDWASRIVLGSSSWPPPAKRCAF